MRVKALTHWIIYKGYKVRFTSRSPQRVEGVLTTPDGAEIAFDYDPVAQMVELPGERIRINDYGWEVEHIRKEPTTGA
jgi:hypothetical protein